jgi:hypothetical protein
VLLGLFAVLAALAVAAAPAGATLPGKDGGLLYTQTEEAPPPYAGSYDFLRHEKHGVVGGNGSADAGDRRGWLSGSANWGASPDGEWAIVPISLPEGDAPAIMRPDGRDKRKLRFKRPDGSFIYPSAFGGAFQFTRSNQIAYATASSGLLLADIDGNIVAEHRGLGAARSASGATGPTSGGPDTVVASDGTVYFMVDQGSQIGIFEWKPGAATVTRLATRPDSSDHTEFPTDVSPDDRALLFQDGTGIHELDIASGQIRTIVEGGPSVTPLQGKYSPDGALVAYTHVAYPYQKTVPIRMVSRSGGAAGRTIQTQDEQSAAVAFVPEAGSLDVSVSGEQLVGDLVELDVAVANNTREPLSDLRYDSGQGTPGIVYNTAPYSEFHRALFTPAGGPTPDLATALGTDQSAEHQYLLNIDSPGFVMARAEVTGTRPNGAPATGGGRAEIYAANRDLAPWEQAMEFTGAWAVIQDQLRHEVDLSYGRMHESIVAAIRKTTPSNKAAAKNTLLERQLAYRFAESEKALSWLPAKTPAALKAVIAYSAQKSAAGTKVIKGKLGNLYNKGVEIPWDYWTGAVADDPYGDVWFGQALYEEGAAWKGKAEGFLADAAALLEDPARRHELKAKVDQTITSLSRTVNEQVKASPAEIKKFARLVAEDPVRAGQYLGDIEGKIRAELGWAVAESMVTGGATNTAKTVLGVGKRAQTFAKAGDFVEDAGRSVPALSSVDELAGAVDLPSAARLGMPEADQGIFQGIVTKLEEKARKHGVDLKLALSFRPSNPHSIAIKDGVGKVLFVKAKAGVELDLMLGMHPDGLGKVAIYKPKLPKDYAMLPAKLRREIDERMGDMTKAYKDWHNPGSDLGRAQRKKGAIFRNNIGVEDQATTTTVNMKLSGKKSGNTIVVRYDHLNVDGRQIVKKGEPKWVVSDYDGNAILTAEGQNLPASIRGMIELEANILIAQEGKKGLRTGFHGFTHNGFDLKGKDYRYVYKYLLEGMNPAQKKKALETYLAKYAEGGSADPIYKMLQSGDLGGDFVIRVTSSGTGVGQGL